MAELRGIEELNNLIEKKVSDAIPVWAKKIKNMQPIETEEKNEQVEVAVKEVSYDKEKIIITLNRSYNVSTEHKLDDGSIINNPNRQNLEGVLKRGGALSNNLGKYGIISGIGDELTSS